MLLCCVPLGTTVRAAIVRGTFLQATPFELPIAYTEPDKQADRSCASKYMEGQIRPFRCGLTFIIITYFFTAELSDEKVFEFRNIREYIITRSACSYGRKNYYIKKLYETNLGQRQIFTALGWMTWLSAIEIYKS